MTVTHSGPDSEYQAATDEVLHEHHPSDALYWKIGAILAVITGLEVSTYFITDDPYGHEQGGLIIGGLIVMMIAKFVTIVGYFMHVKFDNKLFRNVFASGLVLAVGVYLVVLSTLLFWDDGYEQGLRLLS